MKVSKPTINFEDDRGIIKDILAGVPVDAITYLTTKESAIRGNHYHNKTIQYDYILSGQILCRTQSAKGGEIKEVILNEGDLASHEPGERHAFKALVDSAMLSCTHGPRQGQDFESDIVRLKGEEILIKA